MGAASAFGDAGSAESEMRAWAAQWGFAKSQGYRSAREGWVKIGRERTTSFAALAVAAQFVENQRAQAIAQATLRARRCL